MFLDSSLRAAAILSASLCLCSEGVAQDHKPDHAAIVCCACISPTCPLARITPQNAGGVAGSTTTSVARHDWISSWLHAVDTARAIQPHFTAPIVTTHVILVQQYRYDMSWQQDPSGNTTTANYGASRGLEIIPTTRLEIGISPPNYLVHQSSTRDGIGDLAWQVKYRISSATEHKGDYFVGFF